MPFSSMEKLRNMAWATEAEATAELKRNGFKPKGADYELRKNKTHWVIFDLSDDAAQVPPVAAKSAAAPKKTAAKKAAAPKKSDAKPHPTRPPLGGKSVREAKAAAAPKEPDPAEQYEREPLVPPPGGWDAPPITKLPERAAHGVKRTPQSAKLNGSTAPAITPTPEPEAPEPANNMTVPTPAADGPYTIRLGEDVPQHGLAELALHLSVQTGFLMAIVNKAGKVVNTLDGRIGNPKRKPARTARSEGGSSGGSGGRKPVAAEDLKVLVKTLLAKPLTSPEVRKITKWTEPKMSIRNALARIAEDHKLSMTAELINDAGRSMLKFRYVKPATKA